MSWISDQNRQQFQSDGYMVIRGVVPRNLATAAVEEIAQFMGADLAVPRTWYRGFPENDGIVPLHHAQSVWNIRQCPQLYEVFTEFWGNSELMVDMNRCCFRPPCHPKWPTVSRGEIHWDTDPRIARPLALQGIVLLTDVGKNAGGFQCVPEVFRNLKPWLDGNARRDSFHFLRPGISQTGAVQIEGSAGDLILWSTLLPHGPAPNLSDRPRVAAFMTLSPPADSEALRSAMRQWWLEKRAPTYWRGMRGQLDPEPGEPAQLTDLGKCLIGLKRWQDLNTLQ